MFSMIAIVRTQCKNTLLVDIVDQFEHIILIPSQTAFVLIPYCCVLIEEPADTNTIVYSLKGPGLETTIYARAR